jgi:hypothetical protein
MNAEAKMERATTIAGKHRKAIQADTATIKEGYAVAMIVLWSFCLDLEKRGQGKAGDLLIAGAAMFLRDEAPAVKIAKTN